MYNGVLERPLDCEDHAEMAVKSAIEILEATKELNEELKILICLLLMLASVSVRANVLSETWVQPLDLTIPSLEMPSTLVLDSKDKHAITMGWTCCYRNELINSVHQENLQKSIGLTLREKKRKSRFIRQWREPPPRAYWITFTALQILDVHSTHQGLKYDCVYEGNPLVGKKPHLDRLILHKSGIPISVVSFRILWTDI